MKINLLNEKMNVNPERVIGITRKEFYEVFFRIFLVKNHQTLSDNEIKILSCLCSDLNLEDTGISKSNLAPVLKKLEQKELMDGKELSNYTKKFKEKFISDVEIVFNFKIIDDDNRSDNRDGT